MESTTAEVAAEAAVQEAEDIVAKAAKSESKEQVDSTTGERSESRAWDAKAQID